MRKLTALVTVLVFILLVFVPPGLAQEANTSEPEVVELTLEQAVQRALAFDYELEKKKLDVDEADDNRVSVPATYYTEWSPTAEAGIFNAESSWFACERARMLYEARRDALILDVTRKYYGVLNALEKVEAKRAAHAHAEAELRAARAMFSAGVLSRQALDGAEAALEEAKAALAEAQGQLDNAYLALNQLVRFGVQERPVLVDPVPPFEPVELELSVYESRAYRDNPSLEMVRATLEYMRRVENYSVGGDTPVTSTDVKKADLDVRSARQGVQQLVHHLYSGAKALEEAYAAAAKGLAVAEERLRVARVRYEVGLATETAVLEAEVGVATARQRLHDLAAQHTILKLALDKPWAYTSASSAAGGSSGT